MTRSTDFHDAQPSHNGKSSHAQALSIAELRDGSTVRVHPRGELDMATRPQVEDALLRAEDAGAVVIELDLGGLTFMDSSGLHIALEARERARQKGHTLLVLEGAEKVQRIFALTGTEHLLSSQRKPARPPLFF